VKPVILRSPENRLVVKETIKAKPYWKRLNGLLAESIRNAVYRYDVKVRKSPWCSDTCEKDANTALSRLLKTIRQEHIDEILEIGTGYLIHFETSTERVL